MTDKPESTRLRLLRRSVPYSHSIISCTYNQLILLVKKFLARPYTVRHTVEKPGF